MEDFIDFVGGPPPGGDTSFLFCSTCSKRRSQNDGGETSTSTIT